MASGSTTNQAIPYPLITDPTNVNGDVGALANKLDAGYAPLTRGLLAALPTTATPVQSYYFATDVPALFFTAAGGNPPAWTQVWPPLSIPALATYNEKLVTIAASGAAAALDLSQAREFKVTLTANCTLSFTNVPGGAGLRISVGLAVVQDGTGSRTATWPGSVDWGGAGAPTLSTAAGKIDYLGFVSDNNGTSWLGFVGGVGY